MTDEFHQKMSSANVSALWERDGRSADDQEAPHLWSWRALDPLLDAAVEATDTDTAERRVLVLENPAFRDSHRRGAGLNMVVNLQVLMPGESARPHRHSMNALRFIIEGDGGAVTTVDGTPCPMHPGDFLLTPGWCWHEHTHHGAGRAVWLDALDAPLHEHFNTTVFEPGPSGDLPALADGRGYEVGGLLPVSGGGGSGDQAYSPIFRYPLETVMDTLAYMPAAADGSKRVRYTNPLSGGAAMPGLDCYMLALTRGEATRPFWTNANMVCLAVAGEGVSSVGEEEISWQKNDIFSLPRRQWISHKAASGDAQLFQQTDRETLARLDYLREEFQD